MTCVYLGVANAAQAQSAGAADHLQDAEACKINTLHLIPEPCRINKETALEHVIAQCRDIAHTLRTYLPFPTITYIDSSRRS